MPLGCTTITDLTPSWARDGMLAVRRQTERESGFDCRDDRRRCAGTDALLDAIAELGPAQPGAGARIAV
jgi:hypothetical protein